MCAFTYDKTTLQLLQLGFSSQEKITYTKYIFLHMFYICYKEIKKGPRWGITGLRINRRMIRHKADKGIKLLLGHKQHYRYKGMFPTNSAVTDSHTGIRSINLPNTIFGW